MKHQWLVSFWLLGLVCALGPCLGRQVVETLPAALTRPRRSLLGATQQISQCDWIAGEGCALHPSYASFALNRTGSGVVAQYVASSLTCASLVDRGTCEGTSYCLWDSAFTNGQQGCFLHEAAMLALQLQCVQPQYKQSLTKLQDCMAARRSCQCSSSSSSSCQVHQQQLMSTYSSSSKVCQSLLGCWLSSLTSSSTDITQLVEVQLVVVQPKLEQLDSGSAVNSGRRRGLLQAAASGDGSSRQLMQGAPALSQPVLDDTASTSGSSGDGGSVDGGLMLESGSFEDATQPAASSNAPLIGMNGGVLNEAGTAGTTSHTPVENANNVPGLSAHKGSSSTGDGRDELESGTINGNDWVSASTTVDPDQLFGNSSAGSSAGGSNDNGSGGGGGSNAGDGGDSSVQMTGGNAPASFWQCAANAAVKADQTRKWADVDYNSKSLTLATWLKVIQPTALIDWGVEVLECFKAEVSILPTGSSGAVDLSEPNKESTEYAIVALIRAFSGQADVFRSYLQSSAGSRASTGLAGLQQLADETLPGQYKALRSKYNSTAGYDRDVLLQAAAVVADMQWFMMGTGDLTATMSGPLQKQQQQQVIEGVISYGEEMMRRTLYWLFQLQFAGPPAHLPGVPASTRESSAVVAAFDGLSTAALPGPVVAADAPAWQQMQGMVAVAVGWVAAVAKPTQGAGDKVNAALITGNTIDGLAKAHIHNLWQTRLDLARAGAAEAARNLALADPSQFNVRYQPVRLHHVSLLNLLQEQVILGNSSDITGTHMQKAVQDLVASAGAYLLAGNSNSAAAAGVPAAQQQQQQLLAGALTSASHLAYLVRQCKGSPAGLRPLSAAAAALVGVPATPAAACSQLGVEAQKIATQALAGSDALVQTLVQDMNQQWACNALPAQACNSNPACKLAVAATLAPGSAGISSSSSTAAGSAASSSGSASPQAVMLAGTSKAGNVFACEAADWVLRISSKDNGTKSAIAVGNEGCQEFLLMPACEEKSDAAGCSSFASCRWERSTQRNLLHTAVPPGNISGAAAGAPSEAMGGVCAMDWVFVLQSDASTAYSGLSSMINMCSSIRDTAACAAQTMLITLEAQAASSGNMARIWVPVLVVAAVLGVLLFVGAVYWRRRSYTARRAAEEAQSTGHGGRGGKKAGKDGKDGKAKSKSVKKKVKRAEPGSYKPDLMRDSFTDYMRSAPQQFENGVAIAKAAMAAGSLDVGVVVADVAGGRSMEPATTFGHAQAVPSPMAGGYRSGVSGSDGLPPPPAAGYSVQQQPAAPQITGGFTVGSGNHLIELQAADGNIVTSVPLPAAAASSGNGMMLYQQPSSEVWGAAGAASASGLSGGGVLSGGVSGSLLSGGLSGQVDLIDTGASLALTSSLGLVSSLPHHNSVAMSHASGATSHTGLGAGTTDVGGARVGFVGYDMNPLGFGGVQLPLGPRESQEPEETPTTPTSSCCHDSVCTFRQGPGSSVGAGSSTGMVSSSSRVGSSSNGWRAGSGSSSSSRYPRPGSYSGSAAAAPAGVASAGNPARGGVGGSLSGALSGGLSRSSWSSAVSTDMLITQQSSAVLDP